MLHFDMNLSFTMSSVPLLERFQRAADLGFGAVEFFWPTGVNLDDVIAAKEAAGVEVVLINMDMGDMAAGERGLLSHPARKAWWRDALLRAVDFASRLGCPRIHTVAGTRLPDVDRSEQIACAVENLTWAVPHLEKAGIVALVEALNAFDNPTFLITRSSEMFDLCKQINSPHVRGQYDFYHMQRMEGNLIETMRANLEWIGHVQIADSPRRNQPGTGEINYRNVLAALDEAGYSGYIGLEYNPLGSIEDSLSWLPREARKATTAAALRL